MVHLSVLFDINLRLEPEVCYGCMIQCKMLWIFNDVALKGNNDRIYFSSMSKDEVINLLRNADLSEKSGTL